MADSPYPGAIKVGDIIAGRYEVRGMVGRGGMGRIFRVFDKILGEEVALKTLLPDHTGDKIILDRFFNEAKIARSLSHPSIVRVHDIGRAGETVYISMELLKGKSLRQMLDQIQPGQRLPIAGILRMFDALCAALDYAHRYTVHRDIKPENVMILENGAVKLMDFGISKLKSNPNLTSASIVMGTPHYMAPEQMKNTSAVDGRADIYSVGVMLYEVLTGDRPTGLAKPASKIHGEVPAALDPIIEKCCQVDPAKRYQTADELRSALRAVRVAVEKKTDPSGSSENSAPISSRPTARGLPVGRVLVAAVLVLAIAGGAFAGLRWAEKRRHDQIEATPIEPTLLNNTASSEPSPVAEFRALSAGVPKLQRRAEQAAAQYSTAQREELIDPIVALGNELWSAAEEAASAEPARAVKLGWDAVACYLAPRLWPDGMVFVPPSPPDAVPRHRGFFIDARPITTAAFGEFRQSAAWRLPPAADSGADDGPISGVTLFDAVAFVVSAQPPKRLPTVDDFKHALSTLDSERQRVFALGKEPALDEQAPDNADAENADASTTPEPAAERYAMPWLLFPGEDYEGWGEWTSSSVDDTVDIAAATFGDAFFTWGGHWSEEGDFIADDPASANYEDASASLGFRGVLDLPRDQAALARVR